ncbi:hypothetical protein GCM10011341_32960 [Frigidibacter albus]|nr:hypothetical protein GCM10011341_32960 [Frigidibacter albus]
MKLRKRQTDDSGQVLVSGSKHSAKGRPASNSRNTAPIEIWPGARASRKPPLRPRRVSTKPPACSALTICRRWLSEALHFAAISEVRSVRPSFAAQAISTRVARLVLVVRRMKVLSSVPVNQA